MMNENIDIERELRVKRIGSRYGLQCAGAGVIVTYLIMALFVTLDTGIKNGLFWFTEYWFYLIIGVAIVFGIGYYFGQIAAREIIIKRRNSIFVGAIAGIMVSILTVFLTVKFVYIQDYFYSKMFVHYLKSVYYTMATGMAIMVIVGVLLGRRIEKVGNIE